VTDERGYGVTRIIAATDGSHAARRGLERAAELAVAMRAEVVVVHVATAVARWLMEAPDPSFARTRDDLCRLLEDVWAEPLKRAGVRYRTQLLAGDPTEELLRAAEEEDAFLIIASDRGRGAALHDDIGSTAMRLARRASRPVVLVSAGM
jgi:nucleotide-binding universal stress UspA family protein